MGARVRRFASLMDAVMWADDTFTWCSGNGCDLDAPCPLHERIYAIGLGLWKSQCKRDEREREVTQP